MVKHGGQAFWYGLLGLALTAAPLPPGTTYRSSRSCASTPWLGWGSCYSRLTPARSARPPFSRSAPIQRRCCRRRAALRRVAARRRRARRAAGIIVSACTALRLGIYLAIATIAFGFIVQEVLTRWESVTRGNSGITVKSIAVGSFEFDAEWKLYYLALGLLVLAMAG